MAAVDCTEKLTDDIFITFSTLPLFFPGKTVRIMDAKSRQCVSRRTQSSTGHAFIHHRPVVFALALKVERFVSRWVSLRHDSVIVWDHLI